MSRALRVASGSRHTNTREYSRNCVRSASFTFVPSRATPVATGDIAQADAASSTSIACGWSPDVKSFCDFPYRYHFGTVPLVNARPIAS